MKKLLLSLSLAVASVFSVSADTFDVSGASAGWPSMSPYSTNYTSTSEFGGTKWTGTGFANNSGQWEYIRFGAKSATNADAYISSVNPVEYEIEEVSINVTSFIRGTVNSVSLLIADNSEFTDATTVPFNGDFTKAGVWTATVATPVANKYYKININYTNSVSKNGVFDVDKITFSYTQGEAPAVTKPEITGAVDVDKYVVTISSEEGTEVYYTTDGTEPTKESTLYAAPFELWESATVKAVAFKGEDASNTAVFNADVPLFLEDFSQLIGLGENDGFKDVKVVVNGKMTVVAQPETDTRYMFVNCAYNNMQFYQPGKTLNPGDTFNHVEATIAFYGGVVQLSNISFGEITPGTAIEPLETTLDMVVANALYSYFKIEGLTISGVSGKGGTVTDADGNSVALRNQFGITDGFEDATDCTITGFVGVYNGTVQFQPTLIEVGQEAVAAPVITPEDGANVSNYTQVKITAEEGCEIYYKTSQFTEDEPFEVYDEWSVYVQGAAGSTFTVEAYAEKDGVKSETVSATYTIVKEMADIAFITAAGEPISEFTYILGETTDDLLPLLDGADLSENLVLTSSDETVATVNIMDMPWINVLAPGTTTITATVPETETTQETVVTLTLIVEDLNAPKPISEVVVFANQTWEGYTAAAPSLTWVSENKVEFPTTIAVSGTTYSKIYTPDLRVYGSADNKITVNAPANFYFKEVVITVDDANSEGNTPVIDGNKATKVETSARAAASYSDYTYTFSGTPASYVLSCSTSKKNMRVSQVAMTLGLIDTAVDNIAIDNENAPVEYYNLQGVRVQNPENGLYIRRQGSNVSKVIL